MADFIPVALDVKPPQGMSLGEMLNIANSAQQYQQAQQLNPLALQKARMEIEQAQQKNPLEIQRAQMEIEQAQKMNPLAVQKAETELGKSQFELNKSHLDVTGGALTGLESRAKIHAKTGDTKTALKELDSTEKYLNSYGIPSKQDGPLAQAREALKNNDMQGYLAQIENMRNMQASAESKYESNLPQLSTVGGAPASYTKATGTATPLNIGSAGGYTGLTPPATQTNQPPALGNQTSAVGNQGVTQTQMQLPYPVRKAGDIRPFAPNEAQDQDAGFKYRDSLNKAASTMTTSLRNIDEVIKQAEQIGEKEWNKGAGFAGTVGRGVSTFLGTEQGVNYKRLSKDLANLQVSLGADTTTDAGKNLLAAANGDITLPPDVLLDIAHRTRADRENMMMQSQGAQIFSQKYGDANIKKFQKDWSDNSKDSRVFEAISIYNSDTPQDKKVEEINKLFKGASSETMQKIKRQKANLERLSTTGGL